MRPLPDAPCPKQAPVDSPDLHQLIFSLRGGEWIQILEEQKPSQTPEGT